MRLVVFFLINIVTLCCVVLMRSLERPVAIQVFGVAGQTRETYDSSVTRFFGSVITIKTTVVFKFKFSHMFVLCVHNIVLINCICMEQVDNSLEVNLTCATHGRAFTTDVRCASIVSIHVFFQSTAA